MFCQRVIAYAERRRRSGDRVTETVMRPLPAVARTLAGARCVSATAAFTAATEALAHLRYEPLVRRLRGARLSHHATWIEFSGEQKEAERAKLYAERGRTLAPRPPDAAVPLNIGYLLVHESPDVVAATLVAEVLHPDHGVGLTLCPWELLIHVGTTPPAKPRGRARHESLADLVKSLDQASIAASRIESRALERHSLDELDGRLDMRPHAAAPRGPQALRRLAPEIPEHDWYRDLMTEATSICAALGLLAYPGVLEAPVAALA